MSRGAMASSSSESRPFGRVRISDSGIAQITVTPRARKVIATAKGIHSARFINSCAKGGATSVLR